MQSEEDNRLQKLAVLVSYLSPDAAAALLGELPPAIADLVREQASQVGNIDAGRRDAILREFQAYCEPHCEPHCEPQGDNRKAWEDLSAYHMADVLKGERPGVVAACLGQVSETKAGRILASLPDELGRRALQQVPTQTLMPSTIEVLLTAVQKNVASLEAQQEANRQINAIARLAQPELPPHEHPSSTETHDEISTNEQEPWRMADPPLAHSSLLDPPIVVTPYAAHGIEERVEGQIVSEVSQTHNTNIEPLEDFEAITELKPEILESVLESLPAETVLIAVAGASPLFAERLQSLIHPADWKALNEGVSQLGAIRLSDVDHAQAVVLDAVKCLLSPAGEDHESSQLRRAG
ncbi:MAG: FliG C-terminal domain-containing protein [Aureliella sp.]